LGGVLQVGVESGRTPRIREACTGALQTLGGRVIVSGKPAKTHEDGVDQSVVIVEFNNLEKAIAAYESELYKPAPKVFDNAAQRDFRIVEGSMKPVRRCPSLVLDAI
jgi:uncharacterized protein (DUF1330 family)